jgi:hypothetical protein
MNDRPNLNEGKPWSEMDLVDFRSAIGIGRSVMDIADFLCRSEDEVRERIASLERDNALQAWYQSPEYAPLIERRQSAKDILITLDGA